MSPTASPASRAYGVLSVACRGVISALLPTWIPTWRTDPFHSVAGNGVTSPSATEKYPLSVVTLCVSVHSAAPPVARALVPPESTALPAWPPQGAVLSHPLAGMPSQSKWPALQAAMEHAPPVHAGTALGSEHALEHVPQWLGSVSRLLSQPSSPL